MAWQMQSDKTGKVYDFDDDVAPQDALKYLDEVLEPSTQWKDVPAAAAKTIESQGKNIAAGQLRLSELAGRLPGLPGLLGTAAQTVAVPEAQRLEAEGKALAQEAYGDTVPSFAQKAVGTAIPSIALNAVPLLFGAGKATAAVRGGEKAGTALAQGLNTTLGIAATQEGVGEFSEQRQAGQDVVPAALAGGFSGLAEYAGEKFAFTPIKRLLAGGDSTVKKAIFDFIVRDQLGEQATTAMQAFNRKMTREPDMTLADWAEEAALTAASTAIAGPVQAGIAGPTMNLATRGAPQAQPRVEPTETPPSVEPSFKETERGGLVNDSELPIVGMPGITEDNTRELPLDQRLELLRRSWEEFSNKSFQDSAEDRIRKRGEFQARRAEIEQELMLHPEGRALLRESDLAMGVVMPTVELELEQDVDDYAVLDAETLKEREAAREEIPPDADYAETSFPRELHKELGTSDFYSGMDSPLGEDTVNAKVNAGSQAATQRHLAGQSVIAGNRTDLAGQTWEQVAGQLKPEDIVQVGQAGGETIEGAQAYMDLLRELKDRYMPDRPIVLGAAKQGGGVLGQAWITEEGVYAMPIPLGGTGIPATQFSPAVGARGTENLNFSRIAVDATDTLLHEFTHLVHFRHWKDSSTEERKAVAQEYHDDMRFALNANFRDAVERLYSPSTATWMVDAWVKSGKKATDKFDPAFLAARHSFGGNYWYNFNEWMAHKGVKYFTTRLGTSPKTVGFFQRFIRAMQQYYRDYVRRFGDSGQTFNQWMDNIARRESKLKGLLNAEQVKAVREELVRDGLDPDIAQMLAEVRGDDKAWLRQLRDKQIDQQTKDQIAANEAKYFALLGELAQESKRSVWEKKLKDNAYAQRLLQMEPFANFRKFDAGHFFDALMAQMVNARTVTTVQSGGFTAYRFQSKSGNVTALYSPGTNHLQVHAGSYGGNAKLALETALTQFVMRKIAQDGKGELSVTTSDGTRETLEIPYYLAAPPTTPKTVDMESFRLPSGLAAVARTLGVPGMQSSANALGRFNAFFSKALGAYQLIKLNSNVPGMEQEREALRNRMAYRHKWLSAANETVERWAFRLEKTQSEKLSRLLFDESESGKWKSVRHDDPARPGHYIYMLDPQEVSQRGLSLEAQELYSQVRNDFTRFVDEWQKVGLWEISRNELSSTVHYAVAEMMRKDATHKQVETFIKTAVMSIQNPHTQKRVLDQIKNLGTEFENWRAKPYMPYTRFGKYGVLVRDAAKGTTKHFEGHESLDEARAAAEELKKQFPSDAVSSTYLEDVPYMLAGLPPSMLDAMKTRLNLSQQQQDQFAEILSTLSHANSFIHRQRRKQGVAGYSQDALRAYSDYFRRGASYLARVKSEPELNDALNMLKQYIRTQTADPTGVNNVENLGRLHEWFERLHKYLNEAGSEFGELKSLVSLWHFGFNVSTAVVNMTQVPFVTLPWLSGRYGEKAAVAALMKAYKDAANMYAKRSPLTADETAMLDHAMAAGFRNESQATVLAQLADGGALSRTSAHTKFGRGLAGFNHAAMWMFAKGELVNRDVTLIAAYRLKRQQGFNGPFDREAFDFARQAVEDTHNEYAMENRPEFMRGAGSVIFQFMHFSQNMLFNILGGDPSWWRILLAQLFIGGLMGLPFAENLMQGAKAVGRIVFGKDWDAEREARFYAKEIGADPDLLLRGITSNVFGFDLSKRLSFGDVVPGMQTVASHRKLQDAMYGAVGDVGGPGASLVMNAMRFVAEDKTQFDTWKLVMPTALKNMAGAGKAFIEGQVKDRSGAKIFEPDLWDVTGMTVGFQPKELSEAYTARTMQGEKRAYWVTRKRALLEMWDHLVTDRERDREGVADFMKKLKEFNEEAPDAKLRVTGETLRNSVKAKLRSRVMKERGFGAFPEMQQSSKEISETFD